MPSTQLKNKVVAVTGAASGIGLATAVLLASRGASLSLADIQTSALATAQQTIQSTTPSAQIFTSALDVRNGEQVVAWIKDTVSHFGRLDGAVNLAGVVPPSIGADAGLVENIDMGEWDFVMGVNTTGLMLCMKAQLKAIGEGGSIVNASSIAGLTGREKNGIYTASKHAVLGLTRSAAKEVGRRNVRVNAICPGRIDTPMSRYAAAAASAAEVGQEYNKETMSDIALRRSGKPEEVASLIAFLLSDESSYMTGNSISIDGGWNC